MEEPNKQKSHMEQRQERKVIVAEKEERGLFVSSIHKFLIGILYAPGILVYQFFCWFQRWNWKSLPATVLLALASIGLLSAPGILVYQFFCWLQTGNWKSLPATVLLTLVLPKSFF